MNGSDDGQTRIAVILGTSRPNSNTGKALKIVLDELSTRDGIVVDLIDPAQLNLTFPLDGAGGGGDDAEAIRAIVTNATGVIFATPEYHGSPAAMAKLIIENLGFPSTLAGKPIAIMGTAMGGIGAIKALEQLRAILSHIGAIVLPGGISVAGVHNVFDEDGNCQDENIENLLRGLVTKLLDYIAGRAPA